MTYQYCFETIQRENNHPGRFRDRLTKGLVREQSRKQMEIAASQRKAVQIRTMLASLNSTIAMLDSSIGAELERSSIKDPRHYAFPMTVRAMIAQRENLKGTLAALADRLGKVEQILPETEAA
jgi:hypothetical protein